MNAEDLAVRRWREVKKAVEKRNRLVRELNQTNEHVSTLRNEELPRAQEDDRKAYAQAIAAGKGEPERNAQLLADTIEAEERKADACRIAIENAEHELRKLRNENGPSWRREQFRTIHKAHSAYQQRIRDLEQARETLADEVALAGWLVDGIGVSPILDQLSGRNTVDTRSPLSFNHIVQALSTDADDLALHLGETEVRLPWSRVKAHVQTLVEGGATREEALRQAAGSEWGGE